MNQIKVIRQVVKRSMLITPEKPKRNYDQRRRETILRVEDKVLLHRPVRKKGSSEKFLHRCLGLFRIVRRLSNLNYVSLPPCHRKPHCDTLHVSKLKPFYERADESEIP